MVEDSEQIFEITPEGVPQKITNIGYNEILEVVIINEDIVYGK